jgi:hypothetical protein
MINPTPNLDFKDSWKNFINIKMVKFLIYRINKMINNKIFLGIKFTSILMIKILFNHSIRL